MVGWILKYILTKSKYILTPTTYEVICLRHASLIQQNRKAKVRQFWRSRANYTPDISGVTYELSSLDDTLYNMSRLLVFFI